MFLFHSSLSLERALISRELEDLTDLITELEGKISEKEDQKRNTANPIMKERFNSALQKLELELEAAKAKQDELRSQIQDDDDTGL